MKRTLLTMSLVTSHLQLTLCSLARLLAPILPHFCAMFVLALCVYFSILEMAVAMV